jgi:hypothetical protein
VFSLYFVLYKLEILTTTPTEQQQQEEGTKKKNGWTIINRKGMIGINKQKKQTDE